MPNAPVPQSAFDWTPLADRPLNNAPDDASRLSFLLALPDGASDEMKQAAARRVSTALGVPDPDGRVWRSDRQAFATGSEYLDFMRGVVRNGSNIWDYAATPAYKAFSSADDAGRLALAKQDQSAADRAGNAVANALAPEGYGLADDDPAITAAPSDVRAANARLRADREALDRAAVAAPNFTGKFYVPQERQEAAADRTAVDAWRRTRDDAALTDAYHEKLLNENLWAVMLGVSNSLSDRGREIAATAFRNRKLAGADIADFQRLDEREQAVIAKLSRLSRNPVAGTLWNALGDAGIGFVNELVSVPRNVARQTAALDQTLFGPQAGLADTEELNRRARTAQRLEEALDDPAGINPSGAEHGYAARSLIGALSTLPYMAYASVPGVGTTAVALDFMQQLDDDVAREGGDVYGKGASWAAQKAVYGALYAGIEKVSALPVFKETDDVALKTMFLKLATRHGAAAAERVAAHIGKTTFVETLEEAAQRVLEEHATSVGLDKGHGWREAVRAGVSEFAQDLGTMGLVSAVGAARQGRSARSLRGKQSLADFATDTLRRTSFLADDDASTAVSAADQLNSYRTDWKKNGRAALAARPDLTPEQADFLSHVFDGEAHARETASLIEGRNVWASEQSDALNGGVGRLSDADARALVTDAGPDAASRLAAVGFTDSGAARVADYFQKEQSYRAAASRALSDLRAAAARDLSDPQTATKRARDILAAAEPLKPLRDLFQRAGTRDGAASAYREIGFNAEQAAAMADAFQAERALATSPQAAAAFRAFYVETSAEESAADRLARMTGFASEPAPDAGPGAALLTVRDADGAPRGRILYQPDRDEAFDPENPNAGEAVEQATQGELTAEGWKAMTPDQRALASGFMGLRARGGFTVSDVFDPSVRADGEQADLLTGRITIAPDAPSATLYHEAAHAWLAVMRRAGKLTEADVRKLRDRYGASAADPEWFNEETFADDIREIAAASDFTPDRALAARFAAAVRRFANFSRQASAQRRAASDARQALYESIVYGRAFEGVGDFANLPSAAAPAKKPETDPTAGASTVARGNPPPANDERDAPEKPPAAPAESVTAPPQTRQAVRWTAATPQGNFRVSGNWIIASRDRFISDTDPRYDFSLQGRTRDATTASAEQVAAIAAPGTFDPARLLDSPDTSTGAPIAVPVRLKNADGKEETFYMVLSGNGRFRALDAVDADHRGDEYRNPIQAFADERGIPYAPSDFTAENRPRLVRVITNPPEGSTLRQIAERSNQNAVLQMTDAEQASADADLIVRDGTAALFDANRDGLPSRDGSDEFFAWFVRAAGDASLVDSKGNPTDAARQRARRAMLALAVGRGPRGRETVAALTEQADALDLSRQRDALLMSAGPLAALEDAKPEYGLSAELSRAAADLLGIARERKAGKAADAASAAAQDDLLDPAPPAASEILRLLDSGRKAEDIAAALRRYAALASKIDTQTPDMFGEPPTPKDTLLKKAVSETKTEGTRYSLAADPKTKIAQILDMPSVAKVDGRRFEKSDVDLVTQVDAFFKKTHPDGVAREGLGTVRLTRRGVKSSIAHGIGRNKAAAFAAVPEIIANGVEVDRRKNWKGRGYDSFVVAAPIDIGGAPYIAEVVLASDKKNGGLIFHLHEVEEKEKLREAFKTGINTGASQSSRLIIAKLASQVNAGTKKENAAGPVRYALDATGRAYDRKDLLAGFMAHAAMTGQPFPSRETVARLAESIGVDAFDYDALSATARRLATETEDAAIRKAAVSSDPAKAAYAVGELARAAARAYVRSGAREGERLARTADQIRGLSDAGVLRAMAAVTGADYADIETDTDIDIAESILSANPKKFQPRQDQPSPTPASPSGHGPETPAETDAAEQPESDEDAPQLTDKQRADLARKRREREARIQKLLDAARARSADTRALDAKRRRKKAAEEKEPSASAPAVSGDGASEARAKHVAAEEETSTAAPVDFADRWEAAAFLRVWAFDRFQRDNPNRRGEARDISKDRVAVEFYRKTAVRELRDLARKLLDPGAPREYVVARIGDITQGLTANQIERRTAFIFGLINRHAVREERRELVKKFRAEIKRQFIKGAEYEELGVDVDRALTGAIEEDARYVMRVCELSDRALDGETSALQDERDRLNAVLEERHNMTGENGEALAVGDDDMAYRRAMRQLALLDKYGGMVDMMPGEILDLSGKALSGFAQEALALRERWRAYDDLVMAIRDPLAEAIARADGDPKAVETAAGAFADSLTGMLRLRLDYLTRYAEPNKREAGRAAISDFMDQLARGNTDYAIALQDDEAALNQALGEIFKTESGRPDRKRIRAYLRRLDERIPSELAAQLSRQGNQNSMTVGQMLNLLAYLDQWASYKTNIVKHGRAGQAALIRSFVYADAKTGEARPALTSEDVQLLEWMRRRFYADKRETISAVTERLAGRTVDSPDPLYMPVRMLQNKRSGLHVGQGAWKPLAGVFSRRVRNDRDVDETASILDMFHGRSRETALLTAYSERGLVLREVLTSRVFQDAVRRFHGDAALPRILRQVEEALNGGRPRTQTDAQTAAAALAMRVTTYVGLGWNIQSAAKQAVSLPVFAARIGFRRFWKIITSPIDPESVKKLHDSDEHRARYSTGPASGMDIATRAAYESAEDSAFKRFFADWGLWANRKVDWVISGWIAQGLYRDHLADYLDKGMAPADAERRAISETFSDIEETQQSGRTENAMALTREHGLLGKMLTQFATSPLQQMQYEIVSFREWRDLEANGGPEANIREARNRFFRALVINHVIVPGLMAAVSGVYKSATGGEPDWSKDGFWQNMLIACVMGQFSRILFAGAFAEQTLRALLLREQPRMGELIPAEGVIRFAGNLAYPVRDLATWDEEHIRADILRALKSVAVTRLPATIYEHATEP